jgi:conjugal transfer ATP-binding protein TraC
MNSAVQSGLDLTSIEADTALFGTAERSHAIAVLDLVGSEGALASADDTTQEELLAGRAQFLNAQTNAFQILVRAEPVDLEGHLRRVRSRAGSLAEPLASIARDYVSFVQALAHQRTLLERHCYVVVPDRTEIPATTLRRRITRLFRRTPNAAAADESGIPADVARRLTARCDQTARQLGRAGVRTQRLTSQQLGELFHRCWSPELARVQRLREELGAYTTIAVNGHRRSPHQVVLSGDGPGAEEDACRDEDERLFRLGTRSIVDLIAPSGCEVRRDHLRLDGHYTRVLAVTAYPRLVTPGWLGLLVESDLPIELSVHVRPLASVDMVRTLGIQIARLQSSRLAALRGERVADPEREIALEDAERLRERLQRGQERLFAVSLYVLLRAKSIAELDDLTQRVEEQLDALLAHSRRATWEQERGFASCLPEARDSLLVPRNLDTSALAATLPFVGPSLAMEAGMLAGVAGAGQAPVLLDPFDRSLDNANLVVVAPAGAGKSFFCKLLALRQLINGTDCLIVDPEDEYRPLAEAVGGQVVRIAASSNHQLNPFDLPAIEQGPDRLSAPSAPLPDDEDVLAERVTALLGLLEVMLCTATEARGQPGSLSSYECPVLDRAIYRTYAAAGITADPATHNRPAPLLRDLHTTLAATPGDVAASLAMRLERFVNGSLSAGMFAGPTNVALDQPLVVFQIRDLAEELRPLAIHVIASFVWSRVRRNRRPRLLVIDEAWSLLRYAEGGAFVAAIARRARKYYLGLVTITQQVSDVANGGHGETILANAAQVLLLKQKAETIESASDRFRLTQDERQLLLGADKGEGLLLIRGNRVPLRVVASSSEYRLATTNPRDLEQMAATRHASADTVSLGSALASRRNGGARNG